MPGNRLINKMSIYFIGMLSSKILSVLLIPIYAFYVATDDLGYYDYIFTVMGFLVPFIYIAIWEAILRFVLFERNEEEKKTAIATSASFGLFMTCVLIVGFVIFGNWIGTETKFIALIALMFIINGLVNIWQYYSRALEENRSYVIASIVGTVINFLLIVLLICIMKLGLFGLFVSYIISQISIFIIIEYKIHVLRNIKINYININVLKKMLLFTAPMVLNITSTWLMIAFGNLIITHNLGTKANGLFSFANKFSLIVTLIGSAVTMAIIEEAIILAKTKGFDSSFTRTIERIFKIFQSIILIAVPVIVVFYAIIQKTDYYSSMQYAPWLLLYAVVNIMASNIGSVFQAINKTKYQFTTTAMGAFVTVGTSYGLISLIGIYAVVIGQIIGGITMLLARYILINKFLNFKINWKPILGMFGLFLVTTMICLNSHLLINSIILIFDLCFVCYCNWNYVKAGYGFFKSRLDKNKGLSASKYL